MNIGEGFEGLEVWKKGCRLSVDIYKAFSACRDFSLRIRFAGRGCRFLRIPQKVMKETVQVTSSAF